MYKDLLRYDLRLACEIAMSLGMVKHQHPWSITEDEFHFINFLKYYTTKGYGVAVHGGKH
jgi:hypothetical protein